MICGRIYSSLSGVQAKPLLRAITTASTEIPVMSEFAIGRGQTCPPRAPGVLRLYSMRYCPYAQRTRMVLVHKNIPAEIVNVNLKRKPDWLFEMSPTGLVPVLEWDGGHVLHESAACNDYLDEAYPEPRLNPADPYLRARDRQLWESMGKLISSFYDVAGTAGQDKVVMDRLFRAFTRYEKELVSRGQGPFFGGSKVCMADFMIWPWFERLPIVNQIVPETKITPDKYPRLAQWINSMYELPAVKETKFDVESHAHFLKTLRVDKNPDYDYGLTQPAKL
ncbi:glutathione S-transferase omega-1-like [Mya arenaria]|uniref:glutathione S-transferase omega-1-like n=1 Tax=Mya arenaria TaxID=6604 RepID=UPI0022E2806B|nr:glutathione S-transferase omega-1-like [Mya arenaria]XP_052815991.1 glutathione S-transferase omega-1-like [Mya arenaria]